MDRTFHLEWKNYMLNMQAFLETFYSRQDLVDVTLSCRDGLLKAHKVILSACSPYFEGIFRENPCKHPVIILKGISVREMQALLKFMYKGSVDIAEADLSSLVSTASEFKVKGFASGVSSPQNKQNEEKKPTKDVLEALEKSNLVYNCQAMSSEIDSSNGHVNIDGHYNTECVLPRIVKSQSLKENDNLSSNDQRDNVEESKKDSPSKQADADKSPPYPRETRFKGRKRVAVGLRLVTRARSIEKREQDNKNVNNDKRDSDILEATGLVKKMKTNSCIQNDSQVGNVKNNSADLSFKQGIERRLTDGDLDDEGKLLKLVPDIEIKEEQDDANLYCMTTLSESTDSSIHVKLDSASVRGEGNAEDIVDTICPYCYLDCHRSSDLKKHMRSHTGERPHECEFCDLAFARASHLARHRRVHTGERPFTCPNCGRRFSRQDKLKQHVKRHHITETRQHAVLSSASKQYPDTQISPVQKRGRGRPRKVRGPPTDPGTADRNVTSFVNPAVESSNVSLPFGDTSYLSSLSLGQQRYNDLTISPVVETCSGSGPSTSQTTQAEDLLKSVRQLGGGDSVSCTKCDGNDYRESM